MPRRRPHCNNYAAKWIPIWILRALFWTGRQTRRTPGVERFCKNGCAAAKKLLRWPRKWSGWSRKTSPPSGTHHQGGSGFSIFARVDHGIALLLGLAIAGVTLVRMTALERRSQMAETELRRLSGQVRTAQEQERKNLSRELHDEVGQMLTGLRMELGGMSR